MYALNSVAWEVTMGCNLGCQHCGSACTQKLPGELNTQEALSLLDDLAALKVKWIAFAGGEPLLRDDIFELLAAAVNHGIEVRLITNGTLIDHETVEKLVRLKVGIVSVSIDGTCEQHNTIRGIDCYQQCCQALEMLCKAGVATAVNTTLVKSNLGLLPQLKKELASCGVSAWQLQVGLPCGRLRQNDHWVLDVSDIETVVDFAYNENLKNDYPKIFLADTIGYFTNREILSRQMAYGDCQKFPMWNGCSAAISAVGILHNGDVTGCISIRDSNFSQGNIRNQSIAEIWNNPNSFGWRRKMTPEMFSGFCGSCQYSRRCLGGCSNARMCLTGDLYADNPLCLYRNSIHNQ